MRAGAKQHVCSDVTASNPRFWAYMILSQLGTLWVPRLGDTRGAHTCRCVELVCQEEAGVVRCARGPNGTNAIMSAALTSLGRLLTGVSAERAALFTLMLKRGQPSRLCSL